MAIIETTINDNFDQFRVKTNVLQTKVGDLESLTTSVKSDVVGAINELKFDMGSLVVSTKLVNNLYFQSRNAANTGDVSILRVNSSNQIEFSSVPVVSINLTGGTISGLSSPLGIASGGTGGGTQVNARAALGLAIGTDVQAFNSNLSAIAGLSASNDDLLVRVSGAWANRTPSQVRTTLGLVVGTDVQAYSIKLKNIVDAATFSPGFIVYEGTSFTIKNQVNTRTSLGLTIGTNIQAAHENLTQISGITKSANHFIAVNAIGTSYETKSPDAVKSILSLVPGVNIQAFSHKLKSITETNSDSGNFLIGRGTGWVSNTPAQTRVELGLVIGTNVQAQNARLNDISGLTPDNNYFIVGNGSNWVRQDPTTARGSLDAAKKGQNSDIDSLSSCYSIIGANNYMVIGVGAGHQLIFRTDDAEKWSILSTGHLAPLTWETDIGTTDAQVRDIHIRGKFVTRSEYPSNHQEWTFFTYPYVDVNSFDGELLYGNSAIELLSSRVGKAINSMAKRLINLGIFNEV